jgi:pimeloyl-ACP methyl ester carboxylesterase
MARAAETQFTRSGDVDIAYQVFGAGERDIVMTMGWVTHLEIMWELPELAYFLECLGAMGRVIIFDKRGTGLSDRVPGMVTLEQRAEDVRAVMDAAPSERAAFVGWGDGGAIGAMFAATNPERVSALVMSAMTFVTTSTGMGVDPATMQLMQDTVEQGWGSGNQLDFAAPLHASDPRLRTWWRRWERQSATPNAAATLLRWGAEIDPRPVFQALQVPTLFLERAGAGLIDPDSVRAAAALTSCARYVEVPGDDILPFLGDPDPLLGEIAEFLTGARGDVDPDRTLSTVLFTDIVGSTITADRVGDREWAQHPRQPPRGGAGVAQPLRRGRDRHRRRRFPRHLRRPGPRRAVRVRHSGPGQGSGARDPGRAAHRRGRAPAGFGRRSRGSRRRPRRGAGGRERGARHQRRPGAGARFRPVLRGPGRPLSQGGARHLAAVRGGLTAGRAADAADGRAHTSSPAGRRSR